MNINIKKLKVPDLPKKAEKFLNWFLRDDLLEEVEGDLEEQFRDNLERISPFRAKLKYWFQILNYLRPFAIRNLRSTYSNINFMDMFRHCDYDQLPGFIWFNILPYLQKNKGNWYQKSIRGKFLAGYIAFC